MGAETILLGPQEQGWVDLTLKTKCTPRYIPITHDWPAQMEGGLVWGPESFASEEDYTLIFTEEEVSEVKAGLEHFNGITTPRPVTLDLNANCARSRAVWRRSHTGDFPSAYSRPETAENRG